MDYDFSDPMSRDAFADFGLDEDAAWDSFRNQFALSSREQRVGYIRKVDSWLDAPTPTKASAEIWRKRRQLQAINADLIRLGR